MENFQSLFSDDSMSLDMFKEKKRGGNDDFYRPRYQDGKDNQYKAIIRFIPWYKNPKGSIIHKYEYFLKNPLDGDATVHFNSPITVKDGYAEGTLTNCPVQSVWSELYNSENAAEKQLSNKFKRSKSPSKYALVLILNDPQKPELNGKIKIFRLPNDIWKKIESKTTETEFEKPINPMSLIGGLNMKLDIGVKSGENGSFNDYAASEFFGQQSNFPLPDSGGKFQWIKDEGKFVELEQGNEEHMARIGKFLEENSPDFDEIAYKDPTEDELEKVRKIIRYELSGINATRIAQKVLGENLEAHTQMSPNVQTISDSDDDLDNDLDSYVAEVKGGDTQELETVGATMSDDDDMLAGL